MTKAVGNFGETLKEQRLMTKAVDQLFSVKEVIKIIPARDPKQCVCVRSECRKCRDLDALGPREAREVMVVMKVGIVVTVAVVVSE